jgi:hypothetical protein
LAFAEVERAVDFAAVERVPVDRLLVERELVERVPVERVPVERELVERVPVERVPVERVPADRVLVERPLAERLLVERPAGFFAAVERDDVDREAGFAFAAVDFAVDFARVVADFAVDFVRDAVERALDVAFAAVERAPLFAAVLRLRVVPAPAAFAPDAFFAVVPADFAEVLRVVPERLAEPDDELRVPDEREDERVAAATVRVTSAPSRVTSLFAASAISPPWVINDLLSRVTREGSPPARFLPRPADDSCNNRTCCPNGLHVSTRPGLRLR